MKIYMRPAKSETSTPAAPSLLQKARENRRAALAVLRTDRSVSPVAQGSRDRRAGLEAPLLFISNRNTAPVEIEAEVSRPAA